MFHPIKPANYRIIRTYVLGQIKRFNSWMSEKDIEKPLSMLARKIHNILPKLDCWNHQHECTTNENNHE